MVVLGLTPGTVSAGAPTDQLRTAVDSVIAILKDVPLKGPGRGEERLAAVSRIADGAFDFTEIARRALGRHWRNRTEEERDRFTKLFSDLLERTYASLIEARGGYKDEKILIVGESIDGDFAVVRTRIVTTRGTEIPVDYSMLKRGQRWLIYDVSVQNASLVSNYRSQFNAIISTSSYGEMVKRIEAKLEEFRRRDETKAQGG